MAKAKQLTLNKATVLLAIVHWNCSIMQKIKHYIDYYTLLSQISFLKGFHMQFISMLVQWRWLFELNTYTDSFNPFIFDESMYISSVVVVVVVVVVLLLLLQQQQQQLLLLLLLISNSDKKSIVIIIIS